MIEAFRVGFVSRGGTLWDGLDLAFGEGEIRVVTGPPGCGKSALLKILRGERRPDAGDVVVGGRSLYRGDPGAVSAFRAVTGVVPESFPAWTGRTVRDIFLFSFAAGAELPEGERREREENLLAIVGMAGSQRWPVSTLSVSERVRIALAAELIRGPQYLFTDMLLANAGALWNDMLKNLFRALAREGRTIVMAERTFPEGWGGRAGAEGESKGPFRLHRVPSGGEGS
jgi:ABC-type multidrug transport system ATPase subunit